jgi:hypothetical protein
MCPDHTCQQRVALDDDLIDGAGVEVHLAALERPRSRHAPQKRAVDDLREVGAHRQGTIRRKDD